MPMTYNCHNYKSFCHLEMISLPLPHHCYEKACGITFY